MQLKDPSTTLAAQDDISRAPKFTAVIEAHGAAKMR
jgi:hypothetical protein